MATTPLNILVVDDEPHIRKTLTVCLETRAHRVTAVGSAQDAQAEAALKVFDLAFIDLRLGTESGMDLISVLLAASPWLKIVVITAYASIDTAVEAIRRGAFDYIPKPFKPDQVLLVSERIGAVRAMEQRIAGLQEELERLHPEITFQSSHPGMQRAIELAKTRGAKRAVLLPMSAPSHCSLMRPAAERLQPRLAQVMLRKPTLRVINNVDAAIEQDPERIRSALLRQLYNPVRWVESVTMLARAGVEQVVECGPGGVLTALIKRIAPELRVVAARDAAELQELADNSRRAAS